MVDPDSSKVFEFEDPRTDRDLIKLINTGEFQFRLPNISTYSLRQWAQSHTRSDAVTVMLGDPPVELTPRLYDVMYCMADGLNVGQIAHRLDISCRTVYGEVALLKERFGVMSKAEVILHAAERGLLQSKRSRIAGGVPRKVVPYKENKYKRLLRELLAL